MFQQNEVSDGEAGDVSDVPEQLETGSHASSRFADPYYGTQRRRSNSPLAVDRQIGQISHIIKNVGAPVSSSKELTPYYRFGGVHGRIGEPEKNNTRIKIAS